MAEVHDLPGDAPGVEISLEEVEVALLLSLSAQMADFVAPAPMDSEDPLVAMVGIDPTAQMSDDPALQRLLPDAYADDADASERLLMDNSVRFKGLERPWVVLIDTDHLSTEAERTRAYIGITRATMGLVAVTR